jgi:hypothetical protein
MATKTLMAAAAAVLTLANQASARAPAPMIPIALVEDVKSTTADVEFMDYVGTGQLIKLAPQDVLVLSYLKSCAHETITGGTVTVGTDRSEVVGGKVARTRVACDGGKIRLTSQQASASAASAIRLQSANVEPVLYSVTPVIQASRAQLSQGRTLVIERLDKPGKPIEVEIGDDLTNGTFYDLSKAKVRLARNGVYNASLGGRKIMFKIDAKAKTGKAPVVSRLLRFTPR